MGKESVLCSKCSGNTDRKADLPASTPAFFIYYWPLSLKHTKLISTSGPLHFLSAWVRESSVGNENGTTWHDP